MAARQNSWKAVVSEKKTFLAVTFIGCDDSSKATCSGRRQSEPVCVLGCAEDDAYLVTNAFLPASQGVLDDSECFEEARSNCSATTSIYYDAESVEDPSSYPTTPIHYESGRFQAMDSLCVIAAPTRHPSASFKTVDSVCSRMTLVLDEVETSEHPLPYITTTPSHYDPESLEAVDSLCFFATPTHHLSASFEAMNYVSCSTEASEDPRCFITSPIHCDSESLEAVHSPCFLATPTHHLSERFEALDPVCSRATSILCKPASFEAVNPLCFVPTPSHYEKHTSSTPSNDLPDESETFETVDPLCFNAKLSAACSSDIESNHADRNKMPISERAWVRPCKGKRTRYNKLVVKLKKMIDDNPEEFCLDAIDLPRSLFFCPSLKEKLVEVIRSYRMAVLSERRRKGFGNIR